MARDAARRRPDVPRERRLDRRAGARRGDARPRRGADRGARVRAGDRRVRARRASPSSRAGSVELEVQAAHRRGAGRAPERRRAAGARRSSSRRASLVEGAEFSDIDRADVLFRLGVVPLPALEHRDRGLALRRGARARRALGPAVRPPPLARPRRGARAAAAASATGRRRARTSSARSSSPRGSTTRARLGGHLLAGVAGRRAERPVGARAHVRGAARSRCSRSSPTG